MSENPTYVGRRNIMYGGKDLTIRRILVELSKANEKGLSQKFLSDRLGLHRSTINVTMKNLIESGVVKRHGVKGNYYLNPHYLNYNAPTELMRTHITVGLLLNAEFVKRMDQDLVLFQKAAIVNTRGNLNYDGMKANDHKEVKGIVSSTDTYRKYFTPHFDEKSALEKIIFEIVNKIGGYFVFVFINVIEQYQKEIEIKEPLPRKLEEILSYSLSECISEIFIKFVNLMKNYIPNEDQVLRAKEFIHSEDLIYTKSLELTTIYTEAFTNLYPVLFDIFKSKMMELKEEIRFRKQVSEKTVFRERKKK